MFHLNNEHENAALITDFSSGKEGRQTHTHTQRKNSRKHYSVFFFDLNNYNEDQAGATKEQLESWKAVKWWEWGLVWVFLVIMDVKAHSHLTTAFDDCSSDQRPLWSWPSRYGNRLDDSQDIDTDMDLPALSFRFCGRKCRHVHKVVLKTAVCSDFY